jgi:hypothetical protein
MDQNYHDTVSEMEKKGVDPDYVQGWQGGYLHNPPREEQRVSDAYNAGYSDGSSRSTEHMAEWVKQ